MGDNLFDERQTQVLNILKTIHIGQLANYDLSKLLFNISKKALDASFSRALKIFFKVILYDSFRIYYATPIDSDKPLIVTYDYHRNDHYNYWESFKSIIGEYNELKVSEEHFELNSVKKPGEIIKSFASYFKIRKALSILHDRKVEIVLSARITELARAKTVLDLMNTNFKSAFIFFDGESLENLIVQYLRKKNILVATMQHGQPVFHGMECDRINQTMILNFSSDFIMVTGEFSKKQFMLGGVQEKNIFVGGSLRKVNSIRESNNKSFAVFLDCPTNPNAIRDNEELLKCASQIGSILKADYVIKTHPQDDPENYKHFSDARGSFMAKGKVVNDALEGVGFAILHASGVYLDVISFGVKAFCYVNETVFPLVEKSLDSFSSVEDLIIKIETWNTYGLDRKREYMRRIIDYYLCPDGVEERYKSFVNTLNHNRKDSMQIDGE